VASDMKRLITITTCIIASCLAIIAPTKNVYAQSVSYNKAYLDYQYNLTQYNEAFSSFKNAKSAYLSNPTLNLKEEVRLKMFTMLTARDQLLSVYLTTLRVKITEDEGLSDEDKNRVFSKIDDDIKWHNDDKTRYSTNDSLEILLGRNEESKNRYETNTYLTVEEALTYISLGQEISLRLKHEQILSGLKSLIDSGVASGKLIASPFNHWFEDIEATDQLLKQNEEKVRQEILKMDEGFHYSQNDVCDNCKEILSSSVTSLSQFNQFSTEILNYIDNQQ